MPGRTETALHESGRATAPPGVRYTTDPSPTGLGFTPTPAEGYTHTSGNTLADQVAQSPRYSANYGQSPRYSPSYAAAIPKPAPAPSPSLPSQSPQYTPSYYSPSFAPSTSNFGFNAPSTSFGVAASSSGKNFYDNATSVFSSSDHISSTVFNIPSAKSVKSSTSPRYTPNYSNFSYFSNQKPPQSDTFSESIKPQKTKALHDFPKPRKAAKEEPDPANYNIGDFQQFLTKHSSKIKSSLDTVPDSVTDSLLSFLQRKSFQGEKTDSFTEDCIDSNQVVVSVSNKSKPEENKRKENQSSDCAVGGDEERRCKNLEEKRRVSVLRKELLEDLELEDKPGKRDAMSHHYQDDKGHHKRAPTYGDYNQWEYLNPHDGQGATHGRRGHLPFCGTSQTHGMPWNTMGMVPHQSNPYYSNPHIDRGHMIPAHAHAGSDYRLNQWSNSGTKMQRDVNLQNAHQGKISGHQEVAKHHHVAGKSHGGQEFSLGVGAELGKLRSNPHDFVQRTPSTDVVHRVVQEYTPTVSPSLRNPPPLPSHTKSVVGNPLTDLQMLVTSQDVEKPPEKVESYQQETVDLSAHADPARSKECDDISGDKTVDSVNTVIALVAKDEVKNGESSKGGADDIIEKPVELTAKNLRCKDGADKEISSTQSSEPTAVANMQDPQESTQSNNETTTKTSSTPSELEKNKSIEEEVSGTKPNEESTKEDKPMVVEDQGPPTKPSEDATNSVDKEEPTKTPVETKESSHKPAAGGSPVGSHSRLTRSRNTGEVPPTSSFQDKDLSKSTEEPDPKSDCVEVETELEKMLDGVITKAGDSECLPTVSSTSADVKPSAVTSSKKKPARKRPARVSRSNRSSSSETLSSKKKAKTGNSRGRVGRDVGPVLHVEGTRDCPLTVTVVNFPKNEDDDDKRTLLTSNRSKGRHSELEYRGRRRNGLFSSTLSVRYDAHTTDQTWICVLCKKGPHYRCLGDLYGPYVIYRDQSRSQSTCEFSGDEQDIVDAQKRGGRKRSIRANNMVEHFQKMSKKLRRQQSSDVAGMVGMREMVMEDDNSDITRYEVWLHEQCVVWTTGICLIGSRLHGLDEAIWPSIQTMCSKCGEMGANLGCVYRNCGNRAHYICAKESGWCLQQESFISTCHVHKRRS